MSKVFKDKRSPEARRYRTIRIHVYYLTRLHRNWNKPSMRSASSRAKSMLKVADAILFKTPSLTSFDKLVLLGMLYGKTKSRAVLAEAILDHAKNHGKKTSFQICC